MTYQCHHGYILKLLDITLVRHTHNTNMSSTNTSTNVVIMYITHVVVLYCSHHKILISVSKYLTSTYSANFLH